MSMKIIGAGLGRTGTMSLKFALETLGFGPCYHMMEVLQQPQHDRIWHDALTGVTPRWDDLFKGFNATVDWPSAHFWRELIDYYPQAKVILTLRDDQAWYESIRKTILELLTRADGDDPVSVHRQMTRKLVLDTVFDGRFNDADYVRSVFLRHNDRVRDEVAEERLLVYAPGDGWAPLCRFFEVDEPNETYPHVNSSEEYRANYIEKAT